MTKTKKEFTSKPSSRNVSMRDIRSFSSPAIPRITTLRGDQAAASARAAFTLIELLVVVLIIGILAAVALPQYQRAVDKSRYATMIQTARSIENAQDVFYMENGYYATDWEQLAVALPTDLPRTHDGRLSIGHAGFAIGNIYTSAIYYDEGDTRIAAFTLYHRNHTNQSLQDDKGQIRCVSYGARKERGNAICKSFGGELISENANCGGSEACNVYKLADF